MTIATLAVAGALTGGAWTLAGAAIPPESEPTAAGIVSPIELQRPDQEQHLREVAGRHFSAQQQLAGSQVQQQPLQDEVAVSSTEDPPSVESPPADSSPEDPEAESPEPETSTEPESTPAETSSTAAPSHPVDSAAPVSAEPHTRSDAGRSTESSAQVRDSQRRAELEQGGRDD